MLRQWDVFDVDGLDAEGEEARERARRPLDELEQPASRFEEKRDARRLRLRVAKDQA